eukprot:scaffold113891_cov69-Phaeocystis_antarctica.AAC.5
MPFWLVAVANWKARLCAWDPPANSSREQSALTACECEASLRARALAMAAARPCFVFYDRHVEKNAGSTMRVLMKRLEEHGECAYWGYHQGAQAWDAVMHALPQLNSSVAPPRLCGALNEHS